MSESEQRLDPEAKWILAKAEYANECSLFQAIRRGIPKDIRRRSAGQIVQLEYARQQLSKAAKKLRDDEVEYRTSGVSLTLPEPLRATAREYEPKGKVPTKVSEHMGTFEEEIRKGIKLAQLNKPIQRMTVEEQMEALKTELKLSETTEEPELELEQETEHEAE